MSENSGGVHFFKTTIIGGLLFLVPVVVMTPSSPNPWSGMVHIIAAERVQHLNLPITAYMENVERFGQGTNELLAAASSAPTK